MAARLQRVLVANRGEIARRIIRGAHDAGLEAVAVFAQDDRSAPYVSEADLAVLLPGQTLAETYLYPDAIVAAATRANADSVHPGYGFLSENTVLPTACEAAGLTWVGPPIEAMRIMGHKTRAKDTVSAAGVPTLPSVTLTATPTAAELTKAGAEVGFPLLVKASAGGGGRGMRLVEESGALIDAVAAAQREAASAFGSDEVFLERFLRSPRHVEVQVIADSQGHTLHLFDRECSVQRRHQKVIEEAPAVMVDAAIRARMWEAAINAARSVGYEGVGTVEFLVDGDEFFFLEMNTRLQVEHGVTELVTGLDLVGLQFSVAAGLPLPFGQDDVTSNGHAIEARLCAERPREDYRPTPGTAGHIQWPSGPGIRIDAAIESGNTVSPAYDSLVAKVMAFGDDRPNALARLHRALRTLELDALETNRQLLTAIVDDDVFATGQAGIDYLDGRLDLQQATIDPATRDRHAAAAVAALLDRRAAASLVPVPAPGWRNVGTALHVDVLTDIDGEVHVRAPGSLRPISVRHDGEWEEVGLAEVEGDAVDLIADGFRRRYQVRLSAHAAEVNGPEGQSSFGLRSEDDANIQVGQAGECRAPLPGAVTKVLVTVGDVVASGDGLAVLEAMKMEHTLRATGAGTITQVLCAPGQQVDVGDLLIAVEPE
jgi:propionyl-CoA carboxylase alpha chain